MTVKAHKKWIFRIPGLFLVLLILVLPASAAEAANLEIVSKERPYDSDNPVMSQVSPDFKLGKGILTTTYEISSYPGTGVSQLVGWGRVDEKTYIPYLYPKDRKATPTWGIVGQPYKEVNTFEITESLGDMLFRAWLKAPAVCQSMAICHQGTQLAAKQKFTIEFQSADGSATSNDGNDGLDNQIPDLSGTWGGAWSAGYLGQCEIRQSGGSLVFINENGQSSSGKFIDPNTVIASDWEGGLIGHITQNGNRIEWENGSWWESGSEKVSYTDLSGTWDGAWSAGYLGQCEIRQSGSSLTFINENGQSSSGKFIDSDTVIASDWEGGLIGHVTQDGNRIEWENDSWWER